MPRATNSPASRARRKRVLLRAKGFRGFRSKLYRYAKDAVIKAQKDLIASQQEMIGLQEGKNDFANRLRDENQRLIKAQQELLDQRTFGDTP